MTTPVLTKTQQRKSLSAKKASVKGLKNVLTQSSENYWPILRNDHDAELENILKKLLPKLKRDTIKIPWSKCRTLKKEERRAAKLEAEKNCPSKCDEIIRKSIVFGINSATKLLERDDVSCILLDANVDPSLLLKHIVFMAYNKKVPVLIVPFLKKVTLEAIGYASAALSLKKDVEKSPENYFFSLQNKVSALSVEVSIPKIHTSLFQDSIPKNNNEIDNSKIEIPIKEVNFISYAISTDTYLYRKSTKERVFEPPSSKDDKKTNEKWGDFIALDSEKCDISKVKVSGRFFESKNINSNKSDTNQISYKPLKVKRLQGNQCRVKGKRPQKDKKK